MSSSTCADTDVTTDGARPVVWRYTAPMCLRLLGTVVAAALLTSPVYADVRVSMANGRVTIVATDATPRQILEEWARVGQTRLVNAERLTGPPTSIDLENVPEAQALDTLLRSASGYV